MEVDQGLVDEAAGSAAKKASQAAGSSPAAVEQIVRRELNQVLHRHPKELTAEHTLTTGERWAGWVARTSGSWHTILPYLGITALYLIINHWIFAFDSTLQYYTFLVSVLAIFLAQVILLFQNRQSDLESVLAHNSYEQTGEIFAMEKQQVETLEAIHSLVQKHEEVLDKLDDMMIDVHTIIQRVGATAVTADPRAAETK